SAHLLSFPTRRSSDLYFPPRWWLEGLKHDASTFDLTSDLVWAEGAASARPIGPIGLIGLGFVSPSGVQRSGAFPASWRRLRPGRSEEHTSALQSPDHL